MILVCAPQKNEAQQKQVVFLFATRRHKAW